MFSERVMLNQHIHIPYDEVAAFCERNHIRKLSLFGSVLRDDFRDDSDVDVLVEFESRARINYIDLADMQFQLAELFQREIDLLTPGALSERFRQKVVDSAQVIYERK